MESSRNINFSPEIDQSHPKKLHALIKDLEHTGPWRGVTKYSFLLAMFLITSFFALSTDNTALFTVFTILAGFLAASLLILTHDAIHHTLTGWALFDEIAPRISNSILWFHGVYKEIHKIHHKMNGDDINDPERVQWTVEEYEKASTIKRFYIRNQWFFDIFVFAGIGLILKTLLHGFKNFNKSKAIRREFLFDSVGIITFNLIIYSIAYSNGIALKFFLFWLILERISGGILQWRAHIEHYGLWGKGQHFYETQLFNCRNIVTSPIVSWYFNHLNFHSVHHAFPRVPFYHLEEAHGRFKKFIAENQLNITLTEEKGYLNTSFMLARKPILIGPQKNQSKQRIMIPTARL
jgi:fatty acid desaturase